MNCNNGANEINRLMSLVSGAFAVHEASASIHIEPLAKLIFDNPDKAIEQIVSTYNNALDGAYTDEKEGNARAFVEAIAGGPCEIIPWAMYNAIGLVYPLLEKPQRNKAVREILNILDERNYLEVNGATGVGHTTGIREPLLLSDITIARPFYWPGLHDEQNLWKGRNSFSELQSEIMDEEGGFIKNKVRSDFLVAYAILRNDFTDFGEEYVKNAEPEFLQRTLQGIVALRFARAKTDEELTIGMNRLYELLPKSVHGFLNPIREKADWIDYNQFK